MTTSYGPRTLVRHPRTVVRVGATALVSAALIAACGSSSKPSTSGSGSTSSSDTITIKNFNYNPLTVKAGATVTVVNSDQAPHTVTDSGAGKAFDTGTLQSGATTTFTAPTTPGTYDYICTIHSYMHGTLKVVS
ncbi:MAG TPA: cupredoxin domain-containing protein [Mycobacteriales bacterium]|nr:cupredoxin domain-containing protein [Mycobacteriales bacterium]